jgi:UDP-N-acetylglucosamine--N-acetylmuramyl-(pentapeptide) pyrophosphoryl-undecaprenol N-acetylglucosamine transferase
MEASSRQSESIEWLFVGGSGIEKDLVGRESVPYQSISGGGLHGVGLAQAVPNIFRLAAGLAQAHRLLGRFKPNVILATGGFITVPVAIAAKVRRIPLVVYLPDIEPAASVKFIGKLATRVTATAKTSVRYFAKHKFVDTGYPVRRELLDAAAMPKEQARRQFAIAPRAKVVLVFGGSRGARSLNRALIANAEPLLCESEIIHISGMGEWDEVREAREKLPEKSKARYHIYPYLHAEMGAAQAAADLAVSRSGASTLGESPLFGLPSVLVPYPHAWRYQKVNADYLADRGAAIIVKDDDLPNDLCPTVVRLLRDDAARGAMGEKARALARPDAAEAIGRVVRGVAKAD